MPEVTKAKERTPTGGWIGPDTHGWPDLPIRDKPASQRPGYRTAAMDKARQKRRMQGEQP